MYMVQSDETNTVKQNKCLYASIQVESAKLLIPDTQVNSQIAAFITHVGKLGN